MLFCKKCKEIHDLDQAPDEGICLKCNGKLVETEEENMDSLIAELSNLNEIFTIRMNKGRKVNTKEFS